jgi:RHS repeat-associated protein
LPQPAKKCIIVPVQGTVPAFSFSCSARRQERRLRNESSVCPRPGRHHSVRTFRKTCFSKKRTHLIGNAPLRKNSRTTTLGPFGEVIRATGPMAKVNPFMFSTKFYDWETGLYYFGYRYYNPSTGRWPSRDPMGEKGGLNLYLIVANCPVTDSDYLGLRKWQLEAGIIISGQFAYDVCQGNLSFGGWVWAGYGYEVHHTFYGASYSWSGSYNLITGGPHFNCGKCSCCSSSESRWNTDSGWNLVGPFFSGLGATGNKGVGLVFTPDKCGLEVEGILLVDLIKDGAAGPIGTALSYGAGFVGGTASAGLQLNVNMHFCSSSSGGVTVDKASIAGGGYIEIGKFEGQGFPTMP